MDLVASARWANLARGEADIALRPGAFQQQAVFQREVAHIGYGFYASRDYLRARDVRNLARVRAAITHLTELFREVQTALAGRGT